MERKDSRLSLAVLGLKVSAEALDEVVRAERVCPVIESSAAPGAASFTTATRAIRLPLPFLKMVSTAVLSAWLGALPLASNCLGTSLDSPIFDAVARPDAMLFERRRRHLKGLELLDFMLLNIDQVLLNIDQVLLNIDQVLRKTKGY